MLCLGNLGSLLYNMGDYAKAVRVLEETVAGFTAVYSERHAHTESFERQLQLARGALAQSSAEAETPSPLESGESADRASRVLCHIFAAAEAQRQKGGARPKLGVSLEFDDALGKVVARLRKPAEGGGEPASAARASSDDGEPRTEI